MITADIEARLDAARGEIQRLEAAKAALGSGNRRRAVQGRRDARRAAPATAETKVVLLGKLLRLIESELGQTTSHIAKVTGGDQKAILGLLREAEADGEVRREGARRATRWAANPDEDRVAARAAEIAAQSKEPVAA
jgi:hypothetical protein